MLIAVVSDTHRFETYIHKVKEAILNADILIHLGDNVDDAEELQRHFKGKTYIVKGNCDFSVKYPKEQIIQVEGKKIFITHGHLYGVKNSMTNIFYRAKELETDVVLFGHTHESIVLEEDGIILLNPGSVSLPRGCRRSIGFLEVEKGKKVNAYLKQIN